jgi:hypothetical protein
MKYELQQGNDRGLFYNTERVYITSAPNEGGGLSEPSLTTLLQCNICYKHSCSMTACP